MADIDNGKIGIVYDVDTGEMQGSTVVDLKAGRTYCFQLFINVQNPDMFKLQVKKIADVEKVEILNPEIIPSKVWYKDMEFAHNLRFKIWYTNGGSEDVVLSEKSQSGLRVFPAYERESIQDGYLKPGKCTVYFRIDGYNFEGQYMQTAHEIIVVEKISELDLPDLKEDVVYSSNELAPFAGKIQVKGDGYFDVDVKGAGWLFIDETTEEWVDNTQYGYYLEKGRTYLLKVYPDNTTVSYTHLTLPTTPYV